MAKHRSPAYPAISLKEAVDLAGKLYPQASRHPIGAESVAELWSYNSVASASPYIAAVKQFGLLVEEKAGNDRMFQLTSAAKDIAVDPDGKTPERKLAIKKAATTPHVFDDMWEKWGAHPPVDSEIRRYLERERDFNPKYVARVVSNYRATLEFAKLIGKEGYEGEGDEHVVGDGEPDTAKNGNGPDGSRREIKVGSFVQWTSHGIDQFQTPLKVLGIQSGYAFVEGSQTGVPVSELVVVDSPANQTQVATPPPNPFYKPPTLDDEPHTEGVALDRTTLDEGAVRLQWPDDLSPASVEEFQEWMIGRINRARRKAGLDKIKIVE